MGRIIQLGDQQASLLYEDEGTSSVYTQLSGISHNLDTLTDLAPDFCELSEQLSETVIQIQEVARELRVKIDSQDADPEQQQLIDQRLSLVHDLARKLQVEPHQIKDKYLALEARLNSLEHRDERLSVLQKEIETSEQQYYAAAKQLHQCRSGKAKELSAQITGTLKTLGLPDGQLNIQCTFEEQNRPAANGLDHVQILITTNPGMPPMPINKVASGGELSRISLAIQVVATQAKTTPTLIFDEVDAGIGGGVAETVGMRLRELATNRQILCVTHLPQVASQGQQHLFVSKKKGGEQTQTQVDLLDNNQRIREVARMLGGTEMSEKTIAHAQEMVENANPA
jgi:DNA repair protein RecN (Recombination protein N)